MELRIDFDSGEYGRLQSLMSGAPEMFAKARYAALTRTGQNMRKNIRQGMRSVSYLAGRDLTGSIGRLTAAAGGVEVSVTVSGSKKPAHMFKMKPSRITARKGQRPNQWQSPLVQIGPGEAPQAPARAGFSKPFIAQTKSGLKAMYLREKATGNLTMPKIVSPQYFAAFERVKEPVLAEAEQTFMKRLEHEIDYRLGLK